MGVTVPGECFKSFSRVWGVGTGKTGFWGRGKWVGRRKVFRNPPDLMVLDPTGENDEL